MAHYFSSPVCLGQFSTNSCLHGLSVLSLWAHVTCFQSCVRSLVYLWLYIGQLTLKPEDWASSSRLQRESRLLHLQSGCNQGCVGIWRVNLIFTTNLKGYTILLTYYIISTLYKWIVFSKHWKNCCSIKYFCACTAIYTFCKNFTTRFIYNYPMTLQL